MDLSGRLKLCRPNVNCLVLELDDLKGWISEVKMLRISPFAHVMPANRRPAKARQPPQPCKSIPSCCCSRRWDLTTASNTLTVAWQRMYKLNSNCVQKQRQLILEVLRKIGSIVVLAEFLCQVQDKVKPDQEGVSQWANTKTVLFRTTSTQVSWADNSNYRYNCFNVFF